MIFLRGWRRPVNTGIVLVSEPGSPAFEHSDLLAIALNEIGHGLG